MRLLLFSLSLQVHPVPLPLPYFPVNTKTVGMKRGNGTVRYGIYPVRFQPFMRVDNRVTQVAPVRNRQQDNEDTSRSPDIGRNRTRGELPANPNRTRASAGGPSNGGNSTGGAGGNREIIPHRDPGGGGSDGRSSNHGAGRRAGAEATVAAEATRTATPPALHAAALTPTKKSKNYDARSPPRQATTMASPPSQPGFAIYFSRRNSNL
jgi:hypothetical protein